MSIFYLKFHAFLLSYLIFSLYFPKIEKKTEKQQKKDLVTEYCHAEFGVNKCFIIINKKKNYMLQLWMLKGSL